MKRISVPDELYEQLRREAARERVSVSQFVRERLSNKHRRRKAIAVQEDPLLRVAGTLSGGRMTENLDEDLYGL